MEKELHGKGREGRKGVGQGRKEGRDGEGEGGRARGKEERRGGGRHGGLSALCAGRRVCLRRESAECQAQGSQTAEAGSRYMMLVDRDFDDVSEPSLTRPVPGPDMLCVNATHPLGRRHLHHPRAACKQKSGGSGRREREETAPPRPAPRSSASSSSSSSRPSPRTHNRFPPPSLPSPEYFSREEPTGEFAEKDPERKVKRL
eukprot:1955922-Rhodomonas_salina.1